MILNALMISLIQLTLLTTEWTPVEPAVPANLTPQQVDVILLVTKLGNSDYFRLPYNSDATAVITEDLARVCPRGGELVTENADIKLNQQRVSPRSSQAKVSVSVVAWAKKCELLDEQNQKYSLDGRINAQASASGRVIRSERDANNRKKEKYNASSACSLNGILNIVLPDSEKRGTRHIVGPKDFAIAFESSKEDRKTLKEINADPLGTQARRERLIDFYAKNWFVGVVYSWISEFMTALLLLNALLLLK